MRISDADGGVLQSTNTAGVRVVGLGSSAGGLEPLQQSLSAVPTGSGLACVVLQHMDPTHKTLLGELLQRSTSMPVHEAVQAHRIEAIAVFVIPPNTELALRSGALQLAKPSELRGQRLPIDVLFSSMARELGEQAMGVVLSGRGSDGAQGLRAIKTQGGLTLAQQPESAQFDAMPRSAINAGGADLVALPADMPACILGITGVLPALIQRHASQPGPLRAWVVGCSTGEEVYSLDMAFT